MRSTWSEPAGHPRRRCAMDRRLRAVLAQRPLQRHRPQRPSALRLLRRPRRRDGRATRTRSPGPSRAWPTCATAARSAPRNTTPRRPTCSVACSRRSGGLRRYDTRDPVLEGARLSLDLNDLIPAAIVVAIMLLVGLPVHEFSHALAAYRLGDGTAKMFGRLTLPEPA